MRIHSIRHGFATNSSSSHSIILIPEDQPRPHGRGGDGEYDWDNFVLTSRREKARYMTAQLAGLLPGKNRSVVKQQAIQIMSETEPVEDFNYVDHQSRIDMPSVYGSLKYTPDMQLFHELLDYVLRDDVVILGGNDNSDGHPLAIVWGVEGSYDDDDAIARTAQRARELGYTYTDNALMPPYSMRARYADPSAVCRRDPLGHWVTFNKSTGKKVRLSFDPYCRNGVTRSTTPELVDMKITEWCDRGCSYCYQGSHEGGQHADLGQVMNMLTRCSEAQVFEVALGGGEPTAHPDFPRILQGAYALGITPNFSTASLKWMKDRKVMEAVRRFVGGFAVSVDNAGRNGLMEQALKEAKKHNVLDKMSFQYAMGSTDFEWFSQTLLPYVKEHWVPLTLLGPKLVGRGAAAPWHPFGGWLDAVKDVGLREVGIDTSLAAASQDALVDVDDCLYETTEGAFSMYMDAVRSQVGLSSFVSPWEMVRYGGEALEGLFRALQTKGEER